MSNRKLLRLIALLMACPCLLGGCPPPEDDSLEPNDSLQAATPLASGVAVEGRAVQDDPDVFAVPAGSAGTIIFTMDDRGGQDCAAFTATAEDGTVLYADGRHLCGRVGPPDVQVEGAALLLLADGGYQLTVPAGRAGTYYLEIHELPYADNLWPNAWDYRLTATSP